MTRSTENWFRGGPFSMSWTAVFSGIFVAAGVSLLLHVLGLAIGFSQLAPSDASTLRALGIGAGIWTVLTSVLALFCGGWVTARFAGLIGRGNAALQGAVFWGATTLASLVLVFSLASGVGSNMAGMSAPSGMVSSIGQTLDLSTSDALAAVNQRLQAAGKPTITAMQLRSAMRDAVNTALQQGTLDWNTFERALANNTDLSRQEVSEIAAGSRERLTEAVNAAAQATARTFGGLFVTLALSLMAAVGGAALGVTRRQRELSSAAKERMDLPHDPRHHPQAV